MDAWVEKKAGELVTFRTGKLDSNAAQEGGKYPFFTCAQQTYRINRYAFDTECALLAGNNAAGIFPLKYFSGKFNAYQRTYVIEPKDRGELCTKYFYYYLRPLLKAFEQQATGVTTKFLTLKILNSFIVRFPQFLEQRKIAAILTTYDDLIETNKRRIALLEKMAEELYLEWFVRMRFPGHQNTKFVKGLPSNWPMTRIGDVVSFNKGLSYAGKHLCDEHKGIPMVNLKCFRVGGHFRKEGVKYYDGPYRPQHVVQFGDIVLANTDLTQSGGIIGNPALVPDLSGGGKMIISHHLCAVRLGEFVDSKYFFYHLLLSQSFKGHAFGFANGATVLGLRTDDIERYPFLLPEEKLMKKFSDVINPIYDKITLLSKSTGLLLSARDMLLPRLISGKLSVESLDIQFPPSMQEEATAHEPAYA